MLNMALYKREMKGSLKMLVIFAAVISLYVSVIISMYDPEMMKTLDSFYKIMPELMASVGMTAGATSLIGFMISYLYGFILLIFPMIFCILRGNALIARYADKGSMVTLLAVPIKRRTAEIKYRSFVPAFIYREHLFSCFLHFFRDKIQHCFWRRYSGIYVCTSDACKYR